MYKPTALISTDRPIKPNIRIPSILPESQDDELYVPQLHGVYRGAVCGTYHERKEPCRICSENEQTVESNISEDDLRYGDLRLILIREYNRKNYPN